MKLMHCPFCGSVDVQLVTGVDGNSLLATTHIHCNNCGARGPRCVYDNVSVRARAKWNTRPTIDEETVLRVTFKLTE